VKRLPKFATIVDKVVTLPSSVPIDDNDRPHRTRNATIAKKWDTLLFHAPIHVHVLLFHCQQSQHLVSGNILCPSKRSCHVLIMDKLVILPIDASTCVSYQAQPKATRMCHELQPTRSATTVVKRVTLVTAVPIHDTALI
jgi:hypothetical protein